MPIPATALHSGAGPACSSCMPCPMAIRSAATLRVLANNSATSRTMTIPRPRRVYLRRASAPRLSPVARAVRSQISWTAIISGRQKMTVHNVPLRNWAPAWA